MTSRQNCLKFRTKYCLNGQFVSPIGLSPNLITLALLGRRLAKSCERIFFNFPFRGYENFAVFYGSRCIISAALIEVRKIIHIFVKLLRLLTSSSLLFCIQLNNEKPQHEITISFPTSFYLFSFLMYTYSKSTIKSDWIQTRIL